MTAPVAAPDDTTPEWAQDPASPGELVFCVGSGRAFKENEWPMWRARRRAGLRKITWHVLRHTVASHLVMKGVPLKAVQELMGHASLTQAPSSLVIAALKIVVTASTSLRKRLAPAVARL